MRKGSRKGLTKGSRGAHKGLMMGLTKGAHEGLTKGSRTGLANALIANSKDLITHNKQFVQKLCGAQLHN